MRDRSDQLWRMTALLFVPAPTATTTPSRRAVTPLSPPTPLGVARMAQLVPSQCSVIGPTVVAPPTAQMSLAETAAIPSRKLLPRVVGSGLATTLQVVPFHCSMI